MENEVDKYMVHVNIVWDKSIEVGYHLLFKGPKAPYGAKGT